MPWKGTSVLAGDVRVPSRSTVHAVLDRHGLVAHARRRHRFRAEGTALSHALLSNDLWCADFKGEFKLGDGRILLPADGHRPDVTLPACLRGL
jgi:hypothetical protein